MPSQSRVGRGSAPRVLGLGERFAGRGNGPSPRRSAVRQPLRRPATRLAAPIAVATTWRDPAGGATCDGAYAAGPTRARPATAAAVLDRGRFIRGQRAA